MKVFGYVRNIYHQLESLLTLKGAGSLAALPQGRRIDPVILAPPGVETHRSVSVPGLNVTKAQMEHGR